MSEIDTSAADAPSKHEPTCTTCVHFYTVYSDADAGLCRRYPPGAADDLFPRVNSVTSCGEHQDHVAQRDSDLARTIERAFPDPGPTLDAILHELRRDRR